MRFRQENRLQRALSVRRRPPTTLICISSDSYDLHLHNWRRQLYGSLGHVPTRLPAIIFFSSLRSRTKSITANSLSGSLFHTALITCETSLPKVIWEEGRVAALSHTYAVKSPLVTTARPKFAPKSTPFRGPIAKPHYVPHPWTRPTYAAKRHPDPIRRFSTMHWTDRRTYGRTYTDRQADRLSTGKSDDCTGRYATTATRPNNTK